MLKELKSGLLDSKFDSLNMRVQITTYYTLNKTIGLMHIWIVFFLQTALHWAAKKGRKDIAELLINTGMDVNMKSVGIKFMFKISVSF